MDGIYSFSSALSRHENSPLRAEREQFLTYLLVKGTSRKRVRSIASTLRNVIKILQIDMRQTLTVAQIQEGGRIWATDKSFRTIVAAGKDSAGVFIGVAKNFAKFHGFLETAVPLSPPSPSEQKIEEFFISLQQKRALSTETLRSYRGRIKLFLNWHASHRAPSAKINLKDVDDFLDYHRPTWKPKTVGASCNALRGFFRYLHHAACGRSALCACGMESFRGEPRRLSDDQFLAKTRKIPCGVR